MRPPTEMSSTRSRAVVLRAFARPLVVEEFAVPPAEAGAIVVAVDYGGVCGTDLHLQGGHLDVPTPLVLGHEGLGTVHQLGPGVERDANGAALRPGDRVMWASSIACGQCVPCRMHGDPTLCETRLTYGVNRPTTAEPALSGAWADYIYLRNGTTVIKVSDAIDPLAAMSLACAGPTMIRALFERRPVRLGEVVVVQGSGPVGLAAAALAQLAGAAQVVLAGGPAARLDLAAEVGIGDAHVNVVGADEPSDAVREVVELTGGRGADLVIECTGVPKAVDEGMRMARRGGTYLVVGQYTDGGDATINPHQIVYRRLDVLGSWAFTGAHLVEYVRLVPRLVERFDLARLVTPYALADHAVALRDVAAGAVMKAVLTARSMALMLLLAIVGFAACGDGERERDAGLQRLADATGRPEIHKLEVGALPITDLKQLYVADAKGFFAQERLEVEIENFEGGAAIAAAVESGSVDLGWSNSISILQARQRGLGFRFFAGGLYQGPGHWTSAIMVPEDSPIQRPEQLRGRSVAMNTVGNINELVMRAYLDGAGVEPDAYELLEVPFPDQPAALDAGRVDAALPTEPFVTVAEEDGARVLEAKPFRAIGSHPFVAAFFATDRWLGENPNTAAAFRRAVNKATAYWNDHPDERAEIISRYTRVPAAVAEKIALGEPRTEISQGDLQRQIELSHKYGLIPKTFDAAEVLAR
jgi:threonine dehydrogenase-like Zn-dependent dehydrogenase/ABC-type nitrate/sulfonate/bicarbonate transport system substrate-binding protein